MVEPVVIDDSLRPSVASRLNSKYLQIYEKYQVTRLRADQVPYEVYNSDRPKYTFPTHLVAGPAPEVGDFNVHKIAVTNPPGDIAVEVYYPDPSSMSTKAFTRPDGTRPAHIDFHGGGFVIGTLKTDESFCRQICAAVGCIVFNVDYRLSPEFPHPVPAMDCWATVKWVFANAGMLGVDPTRVSVGGFSAGGNLAAVCALLARNERDMQPLVLQHLVVPVIDARFVPNEFEYELGDVLYASYRENEFAPMLPLHRLIWFYKLWLGKDVDERTKKANSFLASPILAKSLAHLAPASIHVAEVDPLASEAIAYHKKLGAAGSSSSLRVYEGMGHTFAHWDGQVPAGKEFMSNTIEALKNAYSL